jgi:ankyrin repeat protein
MSRSLGTNVTDRDRKLQAAVRENQPHLVRNLLEAGADPDTEEPFGAVLSIALLRNFVTVARLLVEAGADVNISDHKGWTPLHWAAKIGDQTLFMSIVEADGDLRARDRDGNTPLDVLSEYRQTDLLKAVERKFDKEYREWLRRPRSL